jgi:hypothetical protein
MWPSWQQKRRQREAGTSYPREGDPRQLGGEALMAGAQTQGWGS